MTQYDMVELSFMADAPEASHVRIPMNAVIVENIWLFWQLSLGINHGIDTYTKIKECSQTSACCEQFCRPASGLALA